MDTTEKELIKIKYKKILSKVINESTYNYISLNESDKDINMYLLQYNCLCRDVYYYNSGWTCSCYLLRS